MRRRFWCSAMIAAAVTTIVVSQATAQSATLTGTDNAALAGISGMVSTDTRIGAQAQTGYVIAGVLEIGFVYGLSYASDTETRQTDIGMTYAVTPLKQGGSAPISVQIYGSYTFRTMDSDFMRAARLESDGQGYTIGLLVAHDLSFSPAFALRFGVTGRHRLYRDVTSTTFVYNPADFTGPTPVDYGQYPLTERESVLEYGPYLAGVYRAPSGFGTLLGVTALMDQDGGVRFLPQVQFVFAR